MEIVQAEKKRKELFACIESIIEDIRENLETYGPRECNTQAVKLAIYLQTIGTLEVNAEADYNREWSRIRASNSTDGATTKRAKNTPEYRIYRELETIRSTVAEIIKTLKKRQDVLLTEATTKI